jgi:hypothetical protein
MGTSLFRFGFALASCASIALAVACGGGSKTAPSEAASPASAANAAPSGGAAAPEGSVRPNEPNSGGPATTTTTQLGSGGDLQGSKLSSSVHTTTESQGDAGPKSTHGQSAGEPGRTMKDIDTIVKVRRDEARACYDKALAAHPGIEGDLDVKWVIDPQGNVSDASVDTTKSSILEPSVGDCIVGVIKKIKFAASAKGFETRAHYPFNFHPKTFTPKDAGK